MIFLARVYVGASRRTAPVVRYLAGRAITVPVPPSLRWGAQLPPSERHLFARDGGKGRQYRRRVDWSTSDFFATRRFGQSRYRAAEGDAGEGCRRSGEARASGRAIRGTIRPIISWGKRNNQWPI